MSYQTELAGGVAPVLKIRYAAVKDALVIFLKILWCLQAVSLNVCLVLISFWPIFLLPASTS